MKEPHTLCMRFLLLHIYFYFLTINMAKIQMGIFPTCQNYVNYRKKLLLLYIVLDIVFIPCDALDFIDFNLYVMYFV